VGLLTTENINTMDSMIAWNLTAGMATALDESGSKGQELNFGSVVFGSDTAFNCLGGRLGSVGWGVVWKSDVCIIYFVSGEI
jgi:hypothetical protein